MVLRQDELVRRREVHGLELARLLGGLLRSQPSPDPSGLALWRIDAPRLRHAPRLRFFHRHHFIFICHW